MLLLKVGGTTINMERVTEIAESSYDVGRAERPQLVVYFGADQYTHIRKPEEIEALRAWLTERSVDLLKAQAVAA